MSAIAGDITTLLTTYGLPTTLALLFAYSLITMFKRVMDENKERELRMATAMELAGNGWKEAYDRNSIAYREIASSQTQIATAIQSLKDTIDHR